MSSLTLPFSATGDSNTLGGTDDTALSITLTSGGDTAISGESYGTDQYDDTPIGVYGATDIGAAVQGSANGTGQGVAAYSTDGAAAICTSTNATGIVATNGTSLPALPADRSAGAIGYSLDNYGVYGSSKNHNGVRAVSGSEGQAAASAENTSTGPALYGISRGVGLMVEGRPAGSFVGDVKIQGKLSVSSTVTAEDVILTGADLAEEFDLGIGAEAIPGTVMVLSDDGIHPCNSDYDTKVAGVVSGAGTFRPGLLLDRRSGRDDARRPALALAGKAYCLVDADLSPISVGDLLTSAATPGHARKATDSARAFGAVIGKALSSAPSGKRLIPVLICLG